MPATVTVFPAATSVKVTVVFSALVAVPSRVTTIMPVCVASAVRTSLLDVPATLKLVTSVLAVLLVKTTVLPCADELAKPARVPLKLPVPAWFAARLAKAVAT